MRKQRICLRYKMLIPGSTFSNCT